MLYTLSGVPNEAVEKENCLLKLRRRMYADDTHLTYPDSDVNVILYVLLKAC